VQHELEEHDQARDLPREREAADPRHSRPGGRVTPRPRDGVEPLGNTGAPAVSQTRGLGSWLGSELGSRPGGAVDARQSPSSMWINNPARSVPSHGVGKAN
jgi:hypothetical protein